MKINPLEPFSSSISDPLPKSMTSPPDEDYRLWKSELERAGLGKRPTAALAEYVHAVHEMRGVDLMHAVDFYRQHHAHIRWITVERLVELYLAEAQELESSVMRTSRRHLEQFAAAFPGPLTGVISTDLQIWFDVLAEQLGTRALHAYRSSLTTLFTWARRQRYWRAGDLLPTEVLDLEEGYLKSADGLLAPAEFQTLLIAAHRDPVAMREVLPLLILGGFAGLRSAELCFYTGADVDLESGLLQVHGFAPRTGTSQTRELKLPAISIVWLRHFEIRVGSLELTNHLQAAWALSRLARRLEIHWPRNALRNSWITYRHALLFDDAQTAREADLPPAHIHKHYANRANRIVAEAWFGILPEWCVME